MRALEEVANLTRLSVLDLQAILTAAGKDKELQRIIRLARLKLRGYSGRMIVNMEQGHITDVQLQTSDVALGKLLSIE